MSARLKTIKVKPGSPEALLTKKLYEEAFPPIERIDYSLLGDCIKNGKAELFAYRDGEEYVGFAFVMFPADYAYLLFCATRKDLRSRGYGSQVLKKLRRRYPTRAMVLDIEPLSDEADNSTERYRRYMFYKNNGFSDTGYEMRDFTGVYRILSDREGFDLAGFIESYAILPEIFEGTEIYRDGKESPVFVPGQVISC